MTADLALPYPPDSAVALRTAGQRCARMSSWVHDLSAALAGAGPGLVGAWDGPAAAACRRELRLVTGLAGSVAGPLRAGALAVRAHGAVVEQARARVDALRRDYDAVVASHARDLADVHAVTDLPGPVRSVLLDDRAAAHADELARLHARHRSVLAEVRSHADLTARRVVEAAREILPADRRGKPPDQAEAVLAALLPLLRARRAAAGVGNGPPAPGTPAPLVRAWWRALTGDEKDRMVIAAAAALGSLGGLPAAVRSRANEHLLDADVALLRARAVLDAGEQRWLDNCLVVREQLAYVRSQPDPLTRRPSVAQLLVFEPRAFGDVGRVAVAVGDLDVADHVAFLVPGLGSDVRGDMAGLTGNAVRVTAEARRASAAAVTATVAWMGYHAPGVGGVAFDRAAEEGADLLAADVLAVQAARDVMPHLTLVGHSYGSTTTGTALRDHRTGADDAVLVGSPGPNVETAGELGVPAGHVFVGASSRDPVSYLDRFGADPTHADFGAFRFRAEDPTRNRIMLDVGDHTKYFDAKTESLSNIVHVVVGRYGELRPAAYRDEVWLLPDGINSDPEADRVPTVVP